MLKIRIIGCLVVKSGIVVQSMGFRRYLPVGRPSIAVEHLNYWGIDEIILLDIDATREGRLANLALIAEASRVCFVPLAVGGGIKCVSDIERVLQAGADKVSLNHAALENPKLISEAANVFGQQCIIVSMDVRQNEVFADSGTRPTGRDPVSFAREVEERGAGEILVNSIDRDGSKNGYDLDLIRSVAQAVRIPVIAIGGVGHPEHFHDGVAKGGVMAAAAGNFFHFTEHSAVTAKAFLRKKGAAVRLDRYATYENFDFDPAGRAAKKADGDLDALFFQYFPKEVI